MAIFGLTKTFWPPCPARHCLVVPSFASENNVGLTSTLELRLPIDIASNPRGDLLRDRVCYYLYSSLTMSSSKAHPPELKKFMDKRISLKLNGGRNVEGVLRGFDPFMNLVLDDSVEQAKSGDRKNIGMVVIRGNSVVMLDAKDRI